MIKAKTVKELITKLNEEGYNAKALETAYEGTSNISEYEYPTSFIMETHNQGYVIGFMAGLVVAGVIDLLTFADASDNLNRGGAK